MLISTYIAQEDRKKCYTVRMEKMLDLSEVTSVISTCTINTFHCRHEMGTKEYKRWSIIQALTAVGKVICIVCYWLARINIDVHKCLVYISILEYKPCYSIVCSTMYNSKQPLNLIKSLLFVFSNPFRIVYSSNESW